MTPLISAAVREFAETVGDADAGPVTVRGGGTRWLVGGAGHPGARQVRAPAGVVAFAAAEMTVRVGAGTTVAELNATLGEGGQTTLLEGPPGATVGGVLMVGHDGIRSLRYGPVRDALLAATYVSAEGRVVHAGGPTVKNVTGFDVCRLLVGSLGTLGLVAEVTLRTRPIPEAARWMAGGADPFAVRAALYRPASVLWDGATTWVLLEGYAADVDAQADRCRHFGLAVSTPPAFPAHRWTCATGDIARFARTHPEAGRFVAELGVGVVHVEAAPRRAPRDEVLASLQHRVRAEFDPTRRLNPGRDPLAV